MQVGRAGCGQFGAVRVLCQANKLSKQTRISKGLVPGADAVAVVVRCYAKVRCCAVVVRCVCKGAGLSQSKVKVLGSCAVRVLSKQTKQGCGSILQPQAWCFGAVVVRCGWCYAGAVPVKLGAGLSKQAKAWYPVRVSCMVLNKDRVGQGLGALCGSIVYPNPIS